MMMQFLCNIHFCFSWALCRAMVVGHNSSKIACLATPQQLWFCQENLLVCDGNVIKLHFNNSKL
jgi:hypothetical protein